MQPRRADRAAGMRALVPMREQGVAVGIDEAGRPECAKLRECRDNAATRIQCPTEATRTLLLARFPVFARLPAPRLDELLAVAPLRHAAAGSVLFEPNMPCEGFPLVLEGSFSAMSRTR